MKAYDWDNDTIVDSNEEGAVFHFKDGELVSIEYIREKNIILDGIEMDVDVLIESNEVELISGK